MLHAGEMTCPGSSVGSEYLTTNQRVGGSSPSQDTIFNTKDFSKRKSKKVLTSRRESCIIVQVAARRHAGSQMSARVFDGDIALANER